jgi:hypothetical protein
MDSTTRCLRCGKRLVPVPTPSGRTELECVRCDDPMKSDKWAAGPLATSPQSHPGSQPLPRRDLPIGHIR